MHRRLSKRVRLVFVAVGLAGVALAVHAADYKVGDRLDGGATQGASAPSAYRDVDWLALVPKDWDPVAELRSLNLAGMQDSDPRAVEALQRLKEAVRNAPIRPEIDGARVRIPGFSIPLERSGGKVTELLLVPYFGACIHVPPPPPNQIIHVKLAKPAAAGEVMQAVYASGTMRIVRIETKYGRVAYAMDAESVVPYER